MAVLKGKMRELVIMIGNSIFGSVHVASKWEFELPQEKEIQIIKEFMNASSLITIDVLVITVCIAK